MLLQETAIRAGVGSQTNVLARPTCMALPVALSQRMVASTGCIGNRIYNDIDDGELYVAIPGKDVSRVADQAQTIATANAKLSEYHEERPRTITSE